MDANNQRQTAIVLFDGVCNLYNASVDFIIEHDPHARFRFAALQNEVAAPLLVHYTRDNHLNSVVLLGAGRWYSGSTASLRIMRRSNAAWPLLYMLIVVPWPIRDRVYRFIARQRYRWFGQTTVCRVPTPELRERFL